MKNCIKKAILNNKDVNVQVSKIMDVIADHTDNEKMKMWRQKNYTLEEKIKKLQDKHDTAMKQLIEIQKILMIKI
jgi:hypothetical protein